MTTRFPLGGVNEGMGPDDQVRQVAPDDWMTAVAAALATHPWFDSLHAIDEIGRPDADGTEVIRVVCRLVHWADDGTPSGLQVHTRVPREAPQLSSLAGVVPGAVWHEREAHDFFGVVFEGGDDHPLLVHRAEGIESSPPMLKHVVLGARVVQPWPGSKDPDDTAQASRRRMAPAGVPDPQVWGERAPGDPAQADEVTQALTGGRVRRRR
ncbi:NADH-quinone oxidoreductase subunit C [Propionibacteriaceae bacterium G1746]|uniref:NADH-quinone oxidoreductase subunit C n=1 Tax=Aestuariimicrobium sp. G57 TaxID=3418485 RepID=UPI003C169273